MDRPASYLSCGIDLSLEPKFRIGTLIVDPAAHEAVHGDVREHLQPQPLKVLIALVRHKGEVVTRVGLTDLCWDGRIIGDDVLNRAILLLRGLAKRSGSFMIETVPKAGYRFIETPDSGLTQKPPGGLAWAAVLALVLAAAIAIWALAPRPAANDPLKPSIALLSFTGDSDPPFQPLARTVDGALFHALSESGMPLRRAASDGGGATDLLLSGSLRRDGSSAVATLRLEQVAQKVVILSKQFRVPLDQADTLPDRVGAYAAATLTWTGAMMVLDRRHPSDPRLTAELLKQGTLTIEQSDWLRAYKISTTAAARAPNSAIAQLSLAINTGFVLGDLPPAERTAARIRGLEAATRAKALAPEFGDIYLPDCVLQPLFRYAFCEDQLRKGMSVDPDAPFVSAYLRRWMSIVGRTREAVDYGRISLANAPYMPGKLAGTMGLLELTGERERAEVVYRNAVRWWPDNPSFFQTRLSAMAQRGDFDAAARFAEIEGGARHAALAKLVQSLAMAVREDRVVRARQACEAEPVIDTGASLCLVALTKLGDLNRAFFIARRVYPKLTGRPDDWRGPRVYTQLIDDPTLLTSPALAPLRRDQRFLALADDLGLLAYWRLGRLPDFCRGATPEAVCSAFRMDKDGTARSSTGSLSPPPSLAR